MNKQSHSPIHRFESHSPLMSRFTTPVVFFDPNDPPAEPGAGDPPETDVAKQFTQSDLSRVATREKKEGQRQGQREVLEALGFTSLEEAQAASQQLKDADASKLSEADRAKAAADKARTDAEAIKAEAQKERHEARVERELAKVGLPDELLAKAMRLVDCEVGSSAEEVSTAIADLKAEMPQLFTTPPEKRDDGPNPSDPGKPPAKKPDADSGKRARNRLEERHGASLKQSNN